jgi:hypothetical protein
MVGNANNIVDPRDLPKASYLLTYKGYNVNWFRERLIKLKICSVD